MKLHSKKAGIVIFVLFSFSLSIASTFNFQAVDSQGLGEMEVTPSIAIGSGIQPREDYGFTVTNETVNVYVQYDCSLDIEYYLEFDCWDFYSDIDVVDVGFPTNEYKLDSVKAWYVDGSGNEFSLWDIRKSTVIDVGVEIWLHGYTIEDGNVGKIHVIGNNPGMMFTDTQDGSKASFSFIPTWFDTNYAGTSIENYNLTFYFPGNYTDGSQLKWHEKPSPWKEPATGLRNWTSIPEQRLYYNWDYTTISQEAHEFGASFPKSWVDESLVKADPTLVLGIWIGLSVFGGLTVLFSVIYLGIEAKKKRKNQYYPPTRKKAPKISGICACVFWIAIILIVVFVNDFSLLIFGVSLALIISGFAFIAYFIGRGLNKKLKYEKPKLSIECVGVNKNLTVPESAIIRNTPLGKVVFLVIFGLLRKGIIGIKSIDPIVFEIKQKIFSSNLRKIDEKGRKIRNYELDFYEAINKKTGTVDKTKLKTMLIKMIKATHKKMVGFDLKATKAYHENLMKKAWVQIRNTKGDIKFDDIEKEFEYIILDDNFDGKAKMVFGSRRIYTPVWYRSYYWHRGVAGRGSGISSLGRGSSGGMMGALNFANSLSTGLSNISSGIVNNVSGFFNSIVNTVSPPPPKSSGGGGGGRSYSGSSCACACACACAGCACACAGGGR